MMEGGIFEPATWLPPNASVIDSAPAPVGRLGTQLGVCWNELHHSPASTLTPLFVALDSAYALGREQEYAGSYVRIVLFLFRTHVAIERVYRRVLEQRAPTGLDRELLRRLSLYRSTMAREVLVQWIEQAHTKHDTFTVSMLMVHLMMTAPPLPRGPGPKNDWDWGADESLGTLTEQDVLVFFPCMAFLNCWFPFGTPSSKTGGTGLLDMSEMHVNDFFAEQRPRMLRFLATCTEQFNNSVMDLILKTVTEGSQDAGGDKWRRMAPDRYDLRAGDIAIDLSTGEIFFKSGAGMKMPTEIAQSPYFKSIFGDTIPNCTPLAHRAAVACIAASHDRVKYCFETWDNSKLAMHASLQPADSGPGDRFFSPMSPAIVSRYVDLLVVMQFYRPFMQLRRRHMRDRMDLDGEPQLREKQARQGDDVHRRADCYRLTSALPQPRVCEQVAGRAGGGRGRERSDPRGAVCGAQIRR